MASGGAVPLDRQIGSEDYGAYGRGGWISRLSLREEVAASVEIWQIWQRVKGYTEPTVAFNPFDASIATGTDRTSLVKVGGQWTHLFGNSVEGNVNGGFVQSFATRSGIVATVTGDGTVGPTIGNQSWFEYGGPLGFCLTNWSAAAPIFISTRGSPPRRHTTHCALGDRARPPTPGGAEPAARL